MSYHNGTGGDPLKGTGGMGSGLPYGNGNGAGVTASAGTVAFHKSKSVSYKSGNSDQIFSVSETTSATSSSGSMPTTIEVANTGSVPLLIMVGYKTYSDEDSIVADPATRYVHYMLMSNEVFHPPVRAVIMTANDANVVQFDGETVDNEAPNSNMYTASGTSINAGEGGTHVIGSTTATNLWLPEAGWTSATNGVHLLFRVGDLIRINNEIMEVTEVGSGADGTNNNYLTVMRGVHGSTAVDTHSASDVIRFAFFNAYHDFDKYSVAQTDSNGRFKCFNMLGAGRSATPPSGIVPGSFAIKFYQPGYQSLGLSGISSSTNSGLTAGETLKLDITVDGGTLFQDLTFTLDSSNVNFGGSSGVISKIQDALDTQYYTAGNLFEKKVHVGIVDGDIRFTSGSHLSTSAILLADTGDSDTFIDAAANGRIPALANVPDAVAARLPDDVVYDRVTYASSPNMGVFGYDDGHGNILGRCNGTINYETGAIDITGCPLNAEFVYSVAHSSAFSGKLGASSAAKGGALTDILANTPSQKWNGSVRVMTW